MSKPLAKALQRADRRDRKRKTKMVVTGKSVVRLGQLLSQPKPPRRSR